MYKCLLCKTKVETIAGKPKGWTEAVLPGSYLCAECKEAILLVQEAIDAGEIEESDAYYKKGK